MGKKLAYPVYGNAAIMLALAAYLFLIPAGILVHDLLDPGLRSGQAPRFAFRWHQTLSAQFEPWARGRVASGSAAKLSTANISGTEWPMFSTVFYLWATEALQDAWEKDPTLAPVMPKEYARGAVGAAAALIADPNHAAWVKQHWGAGYLQHENVFYRMLLISGLTSYQKLLGDTQYQAILQEQVESLAKELDESPYGLLDDYPGQCYPIDIAAAIAAIRRADAVLGTDHSAFVRRALRAFEGTRLDPSAGLPAYRADPRTGRGLGPARGVNTFMLTWAPELWPDTARQWYASYERQFWQEGWLLAGFRELARGFPGGDWLIDVDAGPVISGYGTAASAFGIGAARANGRFDHAYPLSAEALAASWPLPNGTLLGPRMLSNLSDAPYTGEASLLFALTRRPVITTEGSGQARLPLVVYLAVFLYVGAGLLGVRAALLPLWHWRKGTLKLDERAPWLQLGMWLALVLAGLGSVLFYNALLGILFLLLARSWPRRVKIYPAPAVGGIIGRRKS